jgi:DNA modification methylase
MKPQIKSVQASKLTLDKKNANRGTARGRALLDKSLQEFGAGRSILVDRHGAVIAGNKTLQQARAAGHKDVLVVQSDGSKLIAVQRTDLDIKDPKARALAIADNRVAELDLEWDADILAELEKEIDLAPFFEDDELAELLRAGGEEGDATAAAVSLAEKFIVPPFSVLNAREGWWQDRKRAWLSLGIKSEVGRGENLLKLSETLLEPDPKKRARLKALAPGGQSLSPKKGESASLKGGLTHRTSIHPYDGGNSDAGQTGTSIFDPVLCELAYRWFTPEGAFILDPFCGGSVRGIVAAKLGRSYRGLDLRPEQIHANMEQGAAICPGVKGLHWIVGDSRDIAKSCKGLSADFIFSCPPYADLEVYSDDPRDLSTLEYPQFLKAYRDIIAGSCSLLKKDRFACFVVGDVRGKKGQYYNFVSDTISAFRDAGLGLYNEAILVTAVGSLSLRAGRTFSASRKLGKTHQNILVFIKGDWRRATEACGKIETALPDEIAGALPTITGSDPASKFGEVLQ